MLYLILMCKAPNWRFEDSREFLAAILEITLDFPTTIFEEPLAPQLFKCIDLYIICIAGQVRFLMMEYVHWGLSYRLSMGALFLDLFYHFTTAILLIVGWRAWDNKALMVTSINIDDFPTRSFRCTYRGRVVCVFVRVSVWACMWASAFIMCDSEKKRAYHFLNHIKVMEYLKQSILMMCGP
jgi:hypothetical protein